MAELPQQAYLAGVVDCYDCCAPRMTDNLEVGHVAVGQPDCLHIHDEDPTLIHGAYRQRAHGRERSGLPVSTLPEFHAMKPALLMAAGSHLDGLNSAQRKGRHLRRAD